MRISKIEAREKHIAEVKADQAYGVTIQDGSIRNIEWAWVRKTLRRQKKLYRDDRPN